MKKSGKKKASKSSVPSRSRIVSSSVIGGRERRRRRREEEHRSFKAERRARKRLRTDDEDAVVKAVQEDLERGKQAEEVLARESAGRKRCQAAKLAQQELQTRIDSLSSELVCWYPGKQEHLKRLEEEKALEKASRPHGAARPAEEVYPWLYPEYHAQNERQEREFWERQRNKGENLLEKLAGRYSAHYKTFELLMAYLEMGVLMLRRGRLKEAEGFLKKANECDAQGRKLSDRLCCFLVACFIEQGELGKARQLIDREFSTLVDEAIRQILLWDLALIEFVARRVNKEDDSSEELLKKAFTEAAESNNCVALCLADHEKMKDFVDGSVVDEFCDRDLKCAREKAKTGWSREEVAIVYFVRSISWWLDTDPCFQEIAEKLKPEQVNLSNLEESFRAFVSS